jgi:Lrp/AsnC family transcriptional regulator for asnA, asnC and gidA
MGESRRYQLDNLDIAILKHLEQDGRKSYSDIAEDVGVVVSTVSARVTKLIEQNVISIMVLVNPHKVGLEAPATLNIAIMPRHYDQVVEIILGYPEVDFASMTTGDYNLLVDVFCRDTQHLAELITRRLNTLEGIQDIKVTYQLQRLKVRPAGVGLIKGENGTPQEKAITH